MKRLLAIGLLISSLLFSFYQYNGKIVNGECTYPLKQRRKIVDKLLRDRKQEGNYVYLDMVADDFETVVWWYDLDTYREISEKIQFCKVGVR